MKRIVIFLAILAAVILVWLFLRADAAGGHSDLGLAAGGTPTVRVRLPIIVNSGHLSHICRLDGTGAFAGGGSPSL